MRKKSKRDNIDDFHGKEGFHGQCHHGEVAQHHHQGLYNHLLKMSKKNYRCMLCAPDNDSGDSGAFVFHSPSPYSEIFL